MLVQIVGAPIACASGVKDSWRDLSTWVAGQIRVRFGEAVQVKYYDLFDADCPPMPPDAQLPFVMVEGEVVSSGGKISIPSICRRLEERGILTA
jgi:disulfide oxidoreductase YuzD